jgi:hypothetical protein
LKQLWALKKYDGFSKIFSVKLVREPFDFEECGSWME